MKTDSRIVLCLAVGIMLGACSKDKSAETATQDAAAGRAEATSPDPASTECGKGGTVCPAGLACLTWRNGRQACGPQAVPALVLIKDGTLGGSCLSPTDADPYPGASIASVQVMAVDGSVKGSGRMLWDRSGYQVAAERGTPPDGTASAVDACASAYNLGCDGQAVFEIVDGNGRVQGLREGENLVVHLRGQQSCGEQFEDEIEAAICSDPATAKAGDLRSCNSRVRIVAARSDLYGPDRVGGTLNLIRQR